MTKRQKDINKFKHRDRQTDKNEYIHTDWQDHRLTDRPTDVLTWRFAFKNNGQNALSIRKNY
jgi:hypothetical protein